MLIALLEKENLKTAIPVLQSLRLTPCKNVLVSKINFVDEIIFGRTNYSKEVSAYTQHKDFGGNLLMKHRFLLNSNLMNGRSP